MTAQARWREGRRRSLEKKTDSHTGSGASRSSSPTSSTGYGTGTAASPRGRSRTRGAARTAPRRSSRRAPPRSPRASPRPRPRRRRRARRGSSARAPEEADAPPAPDAAAAADDDVDDEEWAKVEDFIPTRWARLRCEAQARADELEDYITEELLSADLLDVLKQVQELNPEKSDPQPQQRLIWRGGGGTLTEAVLKAVKASALPAFNDSTLFFSKRPVRLHTQMKACASEATLKADSEILVKGKLALDQTVLPPCSASSLLHVCPRLRPRSTTSPGGSRAPSSSRARRAPKTARVEINQ